MQLIAPSQATCFGSDNFVSSNLIIDIEEQILCCILLSPEAIEVAKRLPSNAFTEIEHRRIFMAALALHEMGKSTDLMSVASYLHDNGILADAGGQSKLASLADLMPMMPALDFRVDDLLKDYQRRTLVNLGFDLQKHPEKVSEIIDQMEAIRSDQGSTGLRQQLDRLINKGVTGFDLAEALTKVARRNGTGLSEIKYLYEERQREVEQNCDRLSDVHKLRAILKANKSSISMYDVLPKKLARPLTELCKRLNVKPEMLLTVLLGTTSSLHKSATELNLLRSSDFRVSPNLYTAIVAPPSQKKTPIIKAVTEPLQALQIISDERFKADLEAWEAQKKEAEANPEQWDGTFPPKPERPLYYFTEGTGEAIAKQFDKCPEKGILLSADELASVFNNQNKYRGGKGSDRQDMLSYYDGTKPLVMRVNETRGGPGKALLSIVGGIQPAIAKKLMGDCTDEDGMWSRFLWCNQPKTASYISSDSGSYDVKDLLVDLYAYVDSQPAQSHTLSKAASKLFESAYNKYEKKATDELEEGKQAVWGKCAGRVGKMALNLHYIWSWVDGQPPSATISEEVMRMAIALTDYYAEQTLALYYKFSEPHSLPSNLAKVVEVIERMGGTAGASDISRAFTIKHRPKVAEVYRWFKILKEEGFGTIEGEGRNSRFILTDVNAALSIFPEGDPIPEPIPDIVSPPDIEEPSKTVEDEPTQKSHQPKFRDGQTVKWVLNGSTRSGKLCKILRSWEADGNWQYQVQFGKDVRADLRCCEADERWLKGSV